MKWTDEEIDKLFQESAGQINVPPFQEAFWDEMEALLPEKKKNKKGFFWMLSGMITCIAVAAALLIPSGNNSAAKQNTATNTHSIEANIKQSTDYNSRIDGTSNEHDIQPVYVSDFTASGEKIKTRATDPAKDPITWNTNAIRFSTLHKSLKIDNRNNTHSSEVLSTSVTEPSQTYQDYNALANTHPLLQDAFNVEKLNFLKLETEKATLVLNKKAIPLRSINSDHQFYAQVGIGISQSYIGSDVQGVMPLLNLGFGYRYTPQGMGFSAGLHINNVFSSGLTMERSSRVYDFSVTEYTQEMKYRQLTYVEIPLSIDFRKNRHRFSIGITPTVLATTVMKYAQAENNTISENRRYIGQRIGMRTFGLKPTIGYQIEIAKNWSIGAQVNTQVIGQIDEKAFNQKATHFPISGQITVTKAIRKK